MYVDLLDPNTVLLSEVISPNGTRPKPEMAEEFRMRLYVHPFQMTESAKNFKLEQRRQNATSKFQRSWEPMRNLH